MLEGLRECVAMVDELLCAAPGGVGRHRLQPVRLQDEDGAPEVLFGFEVEVQRSTGDAGRFEDVVDARPFVTGLGKDVGRTMEDSITRFDCAGLLCYVSGGSFGAGRLARSASLANASHTVWSLRPSPTGAVGAKP